MGLIKKLKNIKKNYHLLNVKVNTLEAEMNNVKSELDVQRKINDNLWKTNTLLEFKLCQFNVNTNKILYELDLKNLKKDKDFKPLVSIIIPAYNASNYLSMAIDSALNQTYKNIEIIVVNDGSKDNGKTKKVALSYGNKISYYEKENGGVSSALNLGINKMKGDYFAWLSHDDLIEPKHIENMVEFLSYHRKEKIIPFAAYKMIDENGNLLINDTIVAKLHCYDYKMSVINNEYSLLMGEINGGSVLIPKEAFKKYGLFNEDLRVAQERDMWSRIIREYNFINIPYDTAMIRIHGKQVTNTNKNVKKETDEKNMEIINGLSNDVVLSLERNERDFYRKLSYFYKLNGNKEMYDFLTKKLNESSDNNESTRSK